MHLTIGTFCNDHIICDVNETRMGRGDINLCMQLLRRSVISNLCSPRRAAHQAPVSLGFSLQERWSGYTN